MKGLVALFLLGTLGVKAPETQVEVLETIRMEERPFVQGLEHLKDNQVLIGTGLYGKSEIQLVDVEEGSILEKEALPSQYFGEGLTVTDQVIWQFTWKEGRAFKRDLQTLDIIETLAYDGEGWGLAYDGDRQVIWASDGTNRLSQRNPDTFDLQGSIQVMNEKEAVNRLNELEYANGSLFANIWMTNLIIKINPESGQVEKTWDLSQLVETIDTQLSTPDQVLNGIAHLEGDIFYVTGKEFPVMWKVKLSE